MVRKKESESHSVMSTLQPHGLYSPWNSPGQNPGPGDRADSVPAEPQGKPRILEWVGYSLCSRSSPTQEFYWGLLHYRQILYQLGYKGSPKWKWKSFNCVWLCHPMDCSTWNSPAQTTRVGSISLLQEIFPTQGSKPGLLHCKWIHYQLNHKGRPRILG